MTSAREHFLQGVRTALPILPGVAPFGMIAGIAAVESGLSPYIAMAMSMLIFAGASQLAAIQLLTAGAAPVVIILTVVVINLRFAMYSASLAPHFAHLGRLKKLLAGYFLVDQPYAMSIVRYGSMPREAKLPFYLGIGVTVWIVWELSTLTGAVVGTQVPESWSLGFAMPLTFMSMLIVSVRDRAMVVAAIVGGVVATLAQGMPYKLGIVTGAVSGIVAGISVGSVLRARPRTP
ncbi:MAG: branched-chain amino acid ABC transporter permease [Proteobacteria bacterium]|nr:MAG: branched-chain amino acid ABC transporter permease [Pseudomonadota bacterium]